VVEFLTGLLLIAVAALFAMNLWLAARLRQVEQRLAGMPVVPHAGAVAGAGTDAAPQVQPPTRKPATVATVFESLVGGRLLIWVGGIALVVAAVFLIRFTIDIGLIGPELRMAAAALFGLILLGLGEWARGSKRLADDPRIAQALVGAGLAVLYATVYGSHILYGFIGINAASALMLAITALALGLSLRHGIGTAALGLIGGFLTPWLVGDPDAGALPLLAYLALLDVAVFAIAWRRGWGWLAGVAVLLSFAWTGYLLFGPAPDAIAGGWFAVVLGIVAAMLRPAGTSLTWIQPMGIAAIQVTILAARGDVGTAGWLAYAVIAVASVAVTRIKGHPPFIAMLVLGLGLLLLPVRKLFFDESGLVSAAVGMTLLFGAVAMAALDLVPSDALSIAWLVLAIAFIAAGMGLHNFALRVAGLVLLTVTVLKLFLIDAAALEGVLRILSFFGLGVALIVLGRFYGTLLRREGAGARQASGARNEPSPAASPA
jgi:hypothetical protein